MIPLHKVESISDTGDCFATKSYPCSTKIYSSGGNKMYLHIGNSRVISMDEIIGIFNMELKNNQINTQFLESFPGGNLSNKEEQTRNSFIITAKKVCYSSISPLTLQKRVSKIVVSD